MKYFILVPEIKKCGPLNVVKNLVTSEEFSGIEVFICAIRKNKDIIFQNEFSEYENIKIIFLADGGLFNKFLSFKEKLNDINPDVIHANGFFPDIFSAFLSSKIKKITTIHNIIYQDYFSRYKVKGFFFSIFHYLILNFSTYYKILGCSESVSKSLKKFIFFKEISYVNNGVDVKEFKKLSIDERNMIRTRLSINKDTILLVFCGGVEPVKRVPSLISEYINTLEDLNYILYIIGDGPDLKKIVESEKVIKIGNVEDPKCYLQAADIIISNSSSEGYPMAILEALACGCKAFLSDIPSHEYIMSKYPKLAYSISSFNAVNIKKCLSNQITESELKSISSDTMAVNYLSNIVG